ncbi:MAG: tRNA uridine(34) 5-carboxymethylaminomethyl modification radical SAM/GNAT enzyme Elp3 [Candidatus Hydrothermarchaeota archaeon]
MSAIEYIVKGIVEGEIRSKEELEKAKINACKLFNLKRLPSNSEILNNVREEDYEKVLPLLRRKPVRTLSGVTVIAVMTDPYPCPHGRCAYCPGGPNENTPQSYTGSEPASMRGKTLDYDPYKQVSFRIDQLERIGHPVDKIELIVMGGTFTSRPSSYQINFIKGCLEGITEVRRENLSQVIKDCETSKRRVSGITIETRPDYSKEKHVDLMLSYGTTRVELGVQTVFDDILSKLDRGHTVEDVIEATKILKDSGLKVCYHIMPGLPFSDFKRDLKAFKIILKEEFSPDMLKIYPCVVVKGTKIYEWYKRGDYNPLGKDEALKLILEAKKLLPKWIRTMRIQRDIPSNKIVAGVKKTNLGELVYNRLALNKERCRCIRCREVGHKAYKEKIEPKDIDIVIDSYNASDGKEYFISAEDIERDILIGYLRLRIPSEPYRKELDKDTSLVREIHVYGPLSPVGMVFEDSYQHKGFGKKLLREAELISLNEGMKRISVTSGIGVREYFKKLGYSLVGPYMIKGIG